MPFIVGVIMAILIFLFIISFHEFGHFLAAKFFGVGIVEYSIGMGPAVFSKRKGDTVYSIRAVPFGGYCAMYGEESLEASNTGSDPEKKKPKHKKYKIGKQPDFKTEGWRSDQALSEKKWWQRAVICVMGPLFNVIAGIIACFIMVMVFEGMTVPVISSVMEDHPAAESGIQEGDIICGVNGRSVLTMADYFEYVDSHPTIVERGYSITVYRGNDKLTYNAVRDPDDGLFGIYMKSESAEKTFGNVMLYTVNDARYMFHVVFDGLGMFIRGEAHAKDLSGAVGITAMIANTVNEASEAAGDAPPDEVGHTVWYSVASIGVFMLALISINLGVVNMLPLPALDGGRIVLCLFEGIFRRPIPKKLEYAINAVGMMFLMLLMLYTLINDLIKILTGTMFGS